MTLLSHRRLLQVDSVGTTEDPTTFFANVFGGDAFMDLVCIFFFITIICILNLCSNSYRLARSL